VFRSRPTAVPRVHPAWWLSLRADPSAHIQVGSERLEVIATEVTGEEYQRLGRKVINHYPVDARYPKKAKRHIPLMARG
jgi:hypothetical protein